MGTPKFAFHSNKTLNGVEMIVVSGNVMVVDPKLVPQAIVLAVPLSIILISSKSPSFGVPLRFVVNDVILTANAVIVNKSVVLVLIVGVALDATVLTLLCNLALDNLKPPPFIS